MAISRCGDWSGSTASTSCVGNTRLRSKTWLELRLDCGAPTAQALEGQSLGLGKLRQALADGTAGHRLFHQRTQHLGRLARVEVEQQCLDRPDCGRRQRKRSVAEGDEGKGADRPRRELATQGYGLAVGAA